MNTTATQATRYMCKYYHEVCEHATEYGYCRLTACAKRPQTITVSKDKTVSYSNDVVEVVRCKDCKYADEYCHCSYMTWWNSPNDFCSRAERKEK